MARAGAVWVDVLPNMSRFGRDLDRELHEPIVTASRRAGEDGGEAASEGLKGKLKAGALAVGVAAGAALTAGLEQAMDVGKATAKLKGQLNLTGAEAKKAGKAAGDLYAKAVTDSVEDGAEAVKVVLGAGLVDSKAPVKEIRKIATAASDLSTMFDQDITMSAKAASSMLKNGLVKNGTQAFDAMTAGFSKLGPKAEDLAETFNEYSPFMKQLGLDANSTLGILNQGLDAGAWDTDKIGDAMKEFFLLATNGSDTTADSFKALGLKASKTAADIAAGGPRAKKAFGGVLDALREMPKSAKRAQIVSNLFGGPGEDLGASLFALDVDKASKGLGDFSGAAKRAGDDLRDNAAAKIEVFKRQAMMGLANLLTTQVIPAVKDIAPAVKEALGPVRDLWQWLSADPDRMRAAAIALLAIAGAAGALKVASATARGVRMLWGGLRTTASFAMTAGRNIRFAAFAVRYYTVIGAASAKQAVRTGAVWAASAVRSATGWVVARARAVGAFVATAASAVANAVRTGTVWAASAVRAGAGWLVMRARAVGAFAATAAVAAASAARTAAVWVASQVASLASTVRATAALVIQRGAMVAAAAGARIMAAGQLLLNAAMRANPIGLVITALVALGVGLIAAYKKSATFRGIVQGAFRAVLSAGAAMKSGLAAAFRGIADTAAWLWRAIKNPFDAMKRGVGLVGSAFKTAKDAIHRQWTQVSGIVKRPVSIVVNTVYTKGIKKVWDGVADLVNLSPLPTVKFAAGGRTRGGTPGKDSIPALMMADEFVVKRSSARSVGFGALDYINRTGQLPQQSVQRFADGGVVDYLSHPSKAWKAATGWAREKIDQLGEAKWAQAVGKVPLKMLSELGGKIVSGVKSLLTGAVTRDAKGLQKLAGSLMFGKNVTRWSGIVLAALKMVGQPSSLLPVVLRRMNQESGGNPNAINKWDVNAKRGDPSRGLMQTIGSTFNAYAGKFRSRGIYDPLANVYASMRYALATYGSLSKAYNRAGGYAAGGRPRPGELAWVGERGPELVKFRGGEEVYDHRTSLGMAAGQGLLRGFARGTSAVKARAKARGQVPGDLGSFTKSLTGSAGDISKAAGELAKDLRAAGGAGRALATSTLKTSAKLQALAKQRDSVQSRITAAKETAADQKKTAADYIGLSNVGDVTSIGDLITGLKGRQTTARTFQQQIAGLSKKGLSQDLIGQLVAMGPDSTLAKMVSGASAGQIKQLNALAKSGAKLSTSYGTTMADAMYDSGKQAGKGFLAGLKAQEKELQKAMDKLGGSLVAAIKKRLKIKSPSRVAADEVGEQVGAGVVVGSLAMVGDVERAAAVLGQAAVPPPGAVIPATAGRAAAEQQAAGLDGRPLYLVVEDGTVLRAYVSDQVDEALSDVRRRKRAGAR
ncbi:phage tail tape measure protein [Streptomyces sp. NPDC056697]|uniref:phage tail tape measure protein n=1 Tax=Streptomyces sp. NPDC056697 TaxID=3345915 RepID=UPI00367DF413